MRLIFLWYEADRSRLQTGVFYGGRVTRYENPRMQSITHCVVFPEPVSPTITIIWLLLNYVKKLAYCEFLTLDRELAINVKFAIGHQVPQSIGQHSDRKI